MHAGSERDTCVGVTVLPGLTHVAHSTGPESVKNKPQLTGQMAIFFPFVAQSESILDDGRASVTPGCAVGAP